MFSRKGAKEQREKENSLDVILAPLRLCGKCLVAAVLICVSASSAFLRMCDKVNAEDAEALRPQIL